MTVAKAKTSSWKGFAEALVLFHALSSNFWDTMYPEARRARARINAVAWMADMVHQTMVKKDVTLADADAVRTCDEVLNELDRIFAEKFGDAYVGPGQLRSLMRTKVGEIPVPPPEPVPGQEGAVAEQYVQQAAPVAPAAPTTPEEVDGALASNSTTSSAAARPSFAYRRARRAPAPTPSTARAPGSWSAACPRPTTAARPSFHPTPASSPS